MKNKSEDKNISATTDSQDTKSKSVPVEPVPTTPEGFEEFSLDDIEVVESKVFA